MAKPVFEYSLEFAKKLDRKDPLRSYRSKFRYPVINRKKVIYFTGNSLGLQPVTAEKFVNEELEDWATLGSKGHTEATRPWVYYHKLAKKGLALLTGATEDEVVAMNQLTVNLHLMMVSFYRPTPRRYKIITESGAFPSDQYALESQLKYHGLDPGESLIELKPRDYEDTLREEDILNAIQTHGAELALVFFSGVQYYTGQWFDIKKITRAGHAAGAVVGFDLAHAIGNVPLNLHDDEVDFAVWCSYKYLNAGPGAVAGLFIHNKHALNPAIPRFAGWWGHDEKERFLMKKGFKPMTGADGWQLSNVPILQSALLQSSLQLFLKTGIKPLRKKSEMLTGFLEFLLLQIDPDQKKFRIITPREPAQRGCQLSIFMKSKGAEVFQLISKAGVVGDWREPNVIRVAPVPWYNTFEEVYTFAEIFRKVLNKVS